MQSEIELAWAAGFFDGEGNTGVTSNVRHSGGRRHAYVQAQLAQADLPSIERFVRAVGIGRVRGPYDQHGKGMRPLYRWKVAGRNAEFAMEQLLPYLSPAKREQYENAKERACSLHKSS